MKKIFDSEVGAAQFLASAIRSRLSIADAALLAQTIATEFSESTAQARPNTFGLVIQRWVIRNDDLRILEAALDGAKAAAAAGFFLDPTGTTSAIVGISAAVFKLGRQALRKGCIMTPEECRVLTLLVSAGPNGLTIDELSSQIAIVTDESVAADAALALVKRLACMPLADGTIGALVSEDTNGRWRAAGV